MLMAMKRTLNIALSLAAGLFGGLVSTHFAPRLVHAQTAASAPKVVVAQNFVLVNERGVKLGEITVDPDGKPNIRLFEERQSPGGQRTTLIWKARGEVFAPLGMR